MNNMLYTAINKTKIPNNHSILNSTPSTTVFACELMNINTEYIMIPNPKEAKK